MSRAFFPSFFRAAFGGSVLLALLWTGPDAAAAQPKKKEKEKTKTEAADSGPVLLSRTGGEGGGWSNLEELKKAVEKGNPRAEAEFGEVLLRGDENVPQDRPRAIAMLEKAARAGEASAAFRIGMLLDDGVGMIQDRPRAMQYFKAAAAGGATEAMHNIGAAYASARGVKRDYAEALAWMIVAKKRGSQSNAEQAVRDQIQKQRRPELIAAAEKRAAAIEKELAAGSVAEWLPPVPGSETATPSAPAKLIAPPPVPAAPALPPPALAPPKIEPPKMMP